MWLEIRATFAGIALLVLSVSGSKQQDAGRCHTDTWGQTSSSLPRPFLDVDPRIFSVEDKEKTHTPFHTLEKFALNYYPSLARFQAWEGIDLNPRRHHEYEHLDDGAIEEFAKIEKLNQANKPPFWDHSADLASWEIQEPDGWYVRVQEVGPITSTGGYDFWQFGWRDVFGLSDVLQEHPSGIIFDSTFSAAVLPDGTPLGLPPIHIHHIHVGPEIGVKAKEMNLPFLAMEQHGDYECIPSDGGTRCLFEKVQDGYGKVIKKRLDLEGELNDVRAPNSPPLTWFYRVMMRYRLYQPKALLPSIRPISQTFILGPGIADDKQLNTLRVFPVISGEDSAYFYTGRMRGGGRMIRNKLHSHNIAFNRSFFFHATPEQLGLANPAWVRAMTPPEGCTGFYQRFYPNIAAMEGCKSMAVRAMGFDDIDALEAYIFEKLVLAQQSFSRHVEKDLVNTAFPVPQLETPKMVCEAHGARKKVRDTALSQDFWYDRRATVCCKPWHFHDGDDFTVVAFFNKITAPLGPHSPREIPETTDMHVHWVMSFAETQGESVYRMMEMRSDENPSPADRTEWAEAQIAQPLSLLQRQAAGRTGKLSIDSTMRTKADYVLILGEVMLFFLGCYIAYMCSHASQPLTGSATVYAKCCPPCVPRMKIQHVQYNTV